MTHNLLSEIKTVESSNRSVNEHILSDSCGEFKTKQSLKDHVRLCAKQSNEIEIKNNKLGFVEHEESKVKLVFYCQVCEKNFFNDSSLRYHIRRVHFNLKGRIPYFYRKKVPYTNLQMYVCVFCGYFLRKITKFVEQCYRANDLLSNVYQQNTECHIRFLHDFKVKTQIVSNHDVLEETSDAEMVFDDFDDVPLVMLKSESDSSDKLKKKKRKKLKREKIQENEVDEFKVEQDEYMQWNGQVQTDKTKAKRQKVVKEGFTSRMVQETDEYVVIKLTKEQVLQQMQERSKSEEYQRTLYKCEKCVKGFNFEDVLRTHMEKHSMENGPLKCDICTQYCPTAVSLRGHMKSHTTRYSCKVCGIQRGSRQHLLEHHSIAHTSTAVRYACQRCQFTTNKRTVMQRHARSHAARERYACHRCGELFKNLETLRVHTARHDKSKRLQCEQCSRSFIYPSMLYKHTQAVHEREEYYCVECDVKFKSQDNLKLHFKKARRHRDASSYKYQCPQCPQRFVTSSSLSGHLSSTHGEPKQHSCELCPREYSTRQALRGHIRTVHTDAKAKQTCRVCKRSFTRKSILLAHIRTHTGERPFACECGATFAQRATLRAHNAARHHKKSDDNIMRSDTVHDIPNET